MQQVFGVVAKIDVFKDIANIATKYFNLNSSIFFLFFYFNFSFLLCLCLLFESCIELCVNN